MERLRGLVRALLWANILVSNLPDTLFSFLPSTMDWHNSSSSSLPWGVYTPFHLSSAPFPTLSTYIPPLRALLCRLNTLPYSHPLPSGPSICSFFKVMGRGCLSLLDCSTLSYGEHGDSYKAVVIGLWMVQGRFVFGSGMKMTIFGLSGFITVGLLCLPWKTHLTKPSSLLLLLNLPLVPVRPGY